MVLQIESETEVKKHVITLEEYERMCALGVFGEAARIELIRGEIIDMPPPGPEHQSVVSRLHLYMVELVKRVALIWPQGNSIRLWQSTSQPQPDVTLVRWRDDHYAKEIPSAKDVILVIEVSERTLRHDRKIKVALYAESGILEYWVVNLKRRLVEVYSNPSEGTYRSVKMVKPGETLILPGGLEGSITVSDILG